MTNEVVHYLNCQPGKIYVDCTLGGSGHSKAICKQISPNGKLIGIDQDNDAICNAKEVLKPFKSMVHLFNKNFTDLPFILSGLNIKKVDGIILDLGLSLHQLQASGRGFSFKKEEPLDMRMDIRMNLKAEDIVNTMNEKVLTELFYKFGEEPRSKIIARNIIEQNINTSTKTNSQIIFDDQKYKMFVNELKAVDQLTHVKLKNTSFREKIISLGKEKIIENKNPIIVEKRKKYRNRFSTVYVNEKEKVSRKNEVDINNYEFEKLSSSKIAGEDGDKFKLPKRRNYKVEYMMNNLVTQIDFMFLNSTYQPFSGGGSPIYMNPGFNGLIKVGVMDLLEDYRITGGVRLNSNLTNNEYLLSFTNLKHRLDKETIFHRQSIEYYSDYSIVRFQSHELYYILKWPFNEAKNQGLSKILGDILSQGDTSGFCGQPLYGSCPIDTGDTEN